MPVFFLALYTVVLTVMVPVFLTMQCVFPYLRVFTYMGSVLAMLFVLMVFALAAGFVPLPMKLDLYGYSFFTEYPLTLGLPDPAFSLPAGMLVSKIIFLLAGAAFLLLAIWRRKKAS